MLFHMVFLDGAVCFSFCILFLLLTHKHTLCTIKCWLKQYYCS